MKRLSFYIITVLLAIVLGYFLHNMRPKMIPKVITVDTEYSFLMGDGEVGTLMFYVNDRNHALTKLSSYERIVIYDDSDHHMMELSLVTLSLGHEEIYLSERYFRVLMTFKLPFSNHDFRFNHAYISIDLIDEVHYDFRLGKVFFLKTSHDDVLFDYHMLEGRKKDNDYMSRLHHIYVGLTDIKGDISSIYVNPSREVTFIIEDQMLIITIPYDHYLLYETPIRIQFVDGTIHHVPNFRYMIDYMILKESGPLLNIYDVR